MPEPLVILTSSITAFALGVLAVLAARWLWRQQRQAGMAAGGAFGVGAGFLVGAWLLGLAPSFLLEEDKDRLLLVLVPAVVGVEVVAAFFQGKPWLVWPLRWGVAAGAARVLLHNSTYLTDLAGPGTREWSAQQAWLVLGGLAVALFVSWALLNRLARRGAGGAVLPTLALSAAGAGVAVMLSGYATGGQLGFPLAAALLGAALGSLGVTRSSDSGGALGVGLIGLFALLVAGLFFGSLDGKIAALLFAAPLLGWLAELPFARRIDPRLRGCAGAALAALPVAAALALTVQAFLAASTPPPSSAPAAIEPSVQDYMNFGK